MMWSFRDVSIPVPTQRSFPACWRRRKDPDAARLPPSRPPPAHSPASLSAGSAKSPVSHAFSAAQVLLRSAPQDRYQIHPTRSSRPTVRRPDAWHNFGLTLRDWPQSSFRCQSLVPATKAGGRRAARRDRAALRFSGPDGYERDTHRWSDRRPSTPSGCQSFRRSAGLLNAKLHSVAAQMGCETVHPVGRAAGPAR